MEAANEKSHCNPKMINPDKSLENEDVGLFELQSKRVEIEARWRTLS
jgi:hypothetical protein